MAHTAWPRSPEPPQVMSQVRREQGGQESRPLLGHPPLGEAQDLARDLVVDQRAGEEVDQGAEWEPEEF